MNTRFVTQDQTCVAMAPVQAPSTFKRFVQVGRVVLLNDGPSNGKLAVIVEIIDHKRALIEGSSTGVVRQAISYKNLILTPYVLKSLPRAAGPTAVKKAFEASGVADKWAASAWAKKLAAKAKKAESTDFERFELMILKKTRRDQLNKAIYKEKKSA
ncbi:ribosomal protein [Phaffia rhodozyma]|uniref:Ribosomal protein n=1 Tax=Phaffia rhodozyma TaxID=264483 RepID=A0A0F7SLH7_PHARH|nr:ribosomal protein [Phaffia rhodozyma]